MAAKNEILKKCDYFCDSIESENDLPTAMLVVRKLMSSLTDVNPSAVDEVVSLYEGIKKFNNYLTEDEADNIVSGFINQSGGNGARWSRNEVMRALNNAGFPLEVEPYYNFQALYVAINMISADHGNTLSSWFDNDAEKYFEGCYELAVDKLKDADRPHFIREYFHLC